MKISEKVLNQVFTGIEYEDHERVPFFIVDSDSVLVDSEQSFNVVDTFYTETLDGLIYAKMDSTSKNPDGSFNGAEPTSNMGVYRQERQELWQSQFGTAISPTEMMRLRGVHAMTPAEYRFAKVQEYQARQNETRIEFSCELKGKVLNFDIDTQKKFEIIMQMEHMKADPTYLATIHDKDFANHEDFNFEEMAILSGAMMYATLVKEFTEGAFILRLMSLEPGFTKEDVDIAASPPLTEEEQIAIQQKIASKLG